MNKILILVFSILLNIPAFSADPETDKNEEKEKFLAIAAQGFGISPDSKRMKPESPCYQAMFENSISELNTAMPEAYKTLKLFFRGTHLACIAVATKLDVVYVTEEREKSFCVKENYEKELSDAATAIRSAKPVEGVMSKEDMNKFAGLIMDLKMFHGYLCSKHLPNVTSPESMVKDVGAAPSDVKPSDVVSSEKRTAKPTDQGAASGEASGAGSAKSK